MTTPNRTLQDKVRFFDAFAAAKHDIHPDPGLYADQNIDRLSNSEFLERLSNAMEELFAERGGRELE